MDARRVDESGGEGDEEIVSWPSSVVRCFVLGQRQAANEAFKIGQH
jgi:hypothetical protein